MEGHTVAIKNVERIDYHASKLETKQLWSSILLPCLRFGLMGRKSKHQAWSKVIRLRR